MALSFPFSLDTHTWIYYRVSTVHIYLIGYPLLETSFVVTGDISTTKMQPVIIILVINKCYKNQRNPILGSSVSPGLVYPTRNSSTPSEASLYYKQTSSKSRHSRVHWARPHRFIPDESYSNWSLLSRHCTPPPLSGFGQRRGELWTCRNSYIVHRASPVLVNSDHWSEWQWLVP